VDRYGNLTATSGTFTGTVNATGGNISGRMTFGSDYNFYIDGSPGASYRLYMAGVTGSYVSIDNNANFVASGGRFLEINTTSITIRDSSGTSGYIQNTLDGISLVVASANKNLLLRSDQNINFVVAAGYSINFQRSGFLGGYSVFFDSGATIYFNGATIYW
jgi:hypothetical protein